MATPSAVNRYDLYDLIRFAATVVASGGALTQPSSMVFAWRNPLGSGASYVYGAVGASIANPSPGLFYKDLAPDIAGTWGYGWHASGLVGDRETWVFIVDPDVAGF